MSDLGFSLGVHPFGLLGIVISACVLYLAFAVLLSWAGQRILASPSSLDLAILAVLGAIVGRAILGEETTLLGGLVALATLFALETTTGRLRRSAAVSRRVGQRAEPVVVAGRLEPDVLRHHRVDEDTVWMALRAAGVRSLDEVALMVLEKNGRYSVLRDGEPVHPAALTGVRRRGEVTEALREAGLVSEA